MLIHSPCRRADEAVEHRHAARRRRDPRANSALEGLRSPIASHHSGTGKHRRYDASSVYDAAILNAVARAGLHVVTQRYLLEALSAARHAPQKWERTKTRGPFFSKFHKDRRYS
jgi:hypothetical protein